jgi:hypothetical protein
MKGSGAREWTNGVVGGVQGMLGRLGGRNHAETKDLAKGENDSTLESLARREKMGREGLADGHAA